jgi:hypothetical protein
MAVFDPNDWWEGNSWFQTRTKPKERRRPEEINQAVLTRWLGSVSLCLCFSVLAPAAHLAHRQDVSERPRHTRGRETARPTQ